MIGPRDYWDTLNNALGFLPMFRREPYSGKIGPDDLLMLDAYPGALFAYRLGPLGGGNKRFIIVKRLSDGKRLLVDWPMWGELFRATWRTFYPSVITPKHYITLTDCTP